MSRNYDTASIIANTFSQFRNNGLNFENRIQITSTTTFVVPPNTKAIKFTAVGGGQAGTAAPSPTPSTGGPGGGYFEKTFYGPFVGLTTSFVLTVGAAGGNSTLGNSSGTVLATAYGATAISGPNPVGVGGTATGGDINSNGSPGGTSPGVGGASGGPFGPSAYNATYAGRFVYLAEFFTNDNVKNFLITNASAAGGSNISGNSSVGSVGSAATSGTGGAGGAGSDGGLFTPGGTGGAGAPASGNGGPGGPGGAGGFGAPGGPGGRGGPGAPTGGPGGAGGAGGFGAPGGAGGPGGNGTTTYLYDHIK
jgi:hypothetical protein